MNPTVTLFILRLVSAAVLLTFLAAVMWFLYSDMRVVVHSMRAQERPQGELRVIDTAAAGVVVNHRFPLLPVTGIGRNPSNAIVLDDEYTSGEHVLISLRNGRWWVEDLSSRNGTLLNGQLLSDTAVVSSGDVVTIGSTTLKLEL